MLGVKDSGRTPMAWSIRPGFRGDPVLCDDVENSKFLEAAFAHEPSMNLQGGAQNRVAVCSVACLE